MSVNTEKSKSEIAYDYLWGLIKSEDYQPGDRLPTEAKLSEELKINRMTVAKALGSLSNDGYIERVVGRGTILLRKPVSSSSNIMLVIHPWPHWDINDEWYFSRLLYSVQTKAIHDGMAVMLLAVEREDIEKGNFSKIRDVYQAVDCQGIVVIDSFLASHDEARKFLEGLGCPVVMVGTSQQAFNGASCVAGDDFVAAFELTEKLIGAGARNIVFFSLPFEVGARQSRLEGYKKALEKNHIKFDDRYVISNSVPVSMSAAGRECAGVYAARQINDADAIVVAHQLMLKGIFEFCDEVGLPSLEKLRNIPVATFDYEVDRGVASIKYSANQPTREIGGKAVEMLLNLCRGSNDVPGSLMLNHEITAIDS